MCITKVTKVFGRWCGTVLGALLLAMPTNAADVIQVTNTHTKLSWVLSDLIVYGANGERKVILAPNDPRDDITIGPGDSRIFDVGFDVNRYFVSTQIGSREIESFVLQVTPLVPRKLAWGIDKTDGRAVVLAFSQQANYDPPLAVFGVRNGQSPLLPGWAVMTQCDFNTGTVGGPFNGKMVVASKDVQIVTIPRRLWNLIAADEDEDEWDDD